MGIDHDQQDSLEEYGYGSSSTGKTVVIILLSFLLLAALGGAVVLGKLWSDEQAKVLDLEQQAKTFTALVNDLENKNAELSSQLADKQAEKERIVQEWTAQVEQLKKENADQLQRTYAQMNEIIYDSRSTLEYIGQIEGRLRSGEKIDRTDSAKLVAVINGLALLHQQYSKPLNEFRELDRYLSQQLANLPTDQIDPRETASLGRKLFKSKELRAERDAYLESQGRRNALVEARKSVSAAYASAQQQMAKISLNSNQYLIELQHIVDAREASADEIADFFSKSKEILKIHDKIMNIEPPKVETIRP